MKQIDLLHDPVRKVFINYLIPSVSATMVTSIYILADTMMIGRGVGANGLAALNILLPMYSTFYGFGMMCGIGGSVLFGFSRGKGEEKEARGYFTTALILAAILAVLSVVLCNVFFEPLLDFLGCTPAMREYAVPYGRILMLASPLYIFSCFLQAFVRNDGAPRLAMIGVVAGGITNVVLDYIFIYMFRWGMAGAVLATVAGTLLTIVILGSHFLKAENHLKLGGGITPKKFRDVLINGMPSFIMELSSGVIMLLFNLQLLKYVGDIGVVVYGIISNVALVVTSLSNGIAQAAQPMISANYGAGKAERVREGRNLSLAVAMAAGVLFTSSGFLIPVPIAELFLVPTEQIIAMAVPAIKLYFVSFVISEWNIICGTYFQAIVKPKLSLMITVMRGVVLNSILVFVLPAMFGVSGIWAVVTVSEAMTAIAVLYFMRKERG
ncbi:MAG: MATE family efflux transporter [Lachnospiraceae bacterium]|nr:MATE family efflux transporter [Lachnospiraceae bacterium]